MSYTIEKTKAGQDIIINGWENGISQDPYSGISDMRNVDPITIPGEISVARGTESNFTPINISNVTVIVDNTTSVFTYNGTIPLTIGTPVRFTNSGGALPAGLLASACYYILTIPTPTTFTISLSAGGTQKLVTDNGSGTNTFTAINMGTPQEIVGQGTAQGFYIMYDSNGRVWGYLSVAPGTYNNRWIYLNNLTNETTPTNAIGNIVQWKGYILLLTSNGVGYCQVDNFSTMTLKTSWHLTWQSALNGSKHKALVDYDYSLYFCNGSAVGSLLEVEGKTFDPTDATTYNYNAETLLIPSFDTTTCLALLGVNLLIGGMLNYIYPWDKVSVGYNSPIFLSENYISRMVTVNTTTYIFAGYRGRIFITNGSNANLFWKIPDFLSNTTSPYFTWTDATFNRNQLYFGFRCQSNSATTINQYGGLWAIDISGSQANAPRLENIMSYNTYSGYVSAVCQFRGVSYSTVPSNDGYGLFIGWNDGSVGGIDKGISSPYTGGQAYVTTDFLPVGLFLTPKTFTNIEFKLATPLVTGESVALYYRKNITEAFVALPITEGGAVGELSGIAKGNFQNVQWIQIKAVLTSIATNPSYCRLKEIRIR